MSLSPRARRALQLALGAVGVTAALAMLRHTDVNALRRFGGLALLAGGIEGARIGCEALATRSIHGPAVRVPWWPLLRAHAVGYAFAMTLPAGRGVAEATKAVMLSPWTGAARGGGVALTNQSLVFLSTGSVALLGGAAALSLRARNLGAAAGTQGLALIVMGLALLALLRSRTLAARVSGRFPRAAVWLHGVHEGARMEGVPRAWGAFAMHRMVQAVQLFLLLGALGRWEPRTALALTGAAIVGVTLGTALPGQLGAIGAALALAGPSVGGPAPTALAMALVLHAGQFAWAAVGIALWALTRGGQR